MDRQGLIGLAVLVVLSIGVGLVWVGYRQTERSFGHSLTQPNENGWFDLGSGARVREFTTESGARCVVVMMDRAFSAGLACMAP